MGAVIVQPIPYSELRSYWFDHAPDSTDVEDLDDFVYLLRECDKIWLEHTNKKPTGK